MGLNPIQCVLVTLQPALVGLVRHILMTQGSGLCQISGVVGSRRSENLDSVNDLLGFTGFLITWCVWLVI